MLIVGMLFAVLVLGPLLMLAMLAVASNERAVAWLRRVTGVLKRGTDTNRSKPDITPPTADTAPDAPPDDATSMASGATQQSA